MASGPSGVLVKPSQFMILVDTKPSDTTSFLKHSIQCSERHQGPLQAMWSYSLSGYSSPPPDASSSLVPLLHPSCQPPKSSNLTASSSLRDSVTARMHKWLPPSPPCQCFPKSSPLSQYIISPPPNLNHHGSHGACLLLWASAPSLECEPYELPGATPPSPQCWDTEGSPEVFAEGKDRSTGCAWWVGSGHPIWRDQHIHWLKDAEDLRNWKG